LVRGSCWSSTGRVRARSMGFELPFISLLLSLIFTGITGLFPGGIIVPSYLVLFMNQPARIAGTLLAALLALLSYRLASRYLILFGKRRFVFMILLGGLWAVLWSRFIPSFFPASLEFRVIGWVIPGLIANNFERQGVTATAAALATVTVAAYLLGLLLNLTGL
jgi:poly-gamma-glutamate biosynthesis protein PgsC/CapC